MGIPCLHRFRIAPCSAVAATRRYSQRSKTGEAGLSVEQARI